MNLELFIKSDGKIVCLINDKSGEHYVYYKDYILDIYKALKSSKDLSIRNNNINFSTDKFNVFIKSYSNNIDTDLNDLIEQAKKINLINKKKKLRGRKVRRFAVLTGVTIISLGTLVNAFNLPKDNTNYKMETLSGFETLYSVKANDEISNIDSENNVAQDVLESKENYDVSLMDRTDSDKFINTKKKYGSIIEKISLEYGLDPNIMLAIATQESGVHNINSNGPAIGLMQIEKSVWNNQDISAFNYNTNSYETQHITTEKLKDLKFNIRVSCMIFQKCLKETNYNIPVAIQMYNYGYGNILKTISNYYNGNVDSKEIFKSNDLDWLDARSTISAGDKEYLEHVLSYVEDKDNICFKKDDGNIFCSISNKNVKKM